MSNLRLPRIEHCALSPGFKHCSPEDGLLNTTSPSVFQPLGRCHPDPSSLWSEESGFCSTPPWCPLRCKVGGAPGRDVGRLEMESGHAATVQCEARSSQRMEEGRLTFVEESLTSFKAAAHQSRPAARPGVRKKQKRTCRTSLGLQGSVLNKKIQKRVQCREERCKG